LGEEEEEEWGERQKCGMTIWLSSSMYTHMHTPLSDTLSHALRQASQWLFLAVLALIRAAPETADCFCAGNQSSEHPACRHGAQRLKKKNLALDIVVTRSSSPPPWPPQDCWGLR